MRTNDTGATIWPAGRSFAITGACYERRPPAILPAVRRAIASILIVVGLVIGAFTLSGWWVRRTAFVTSRTERLADDILADPVLRDDLARRIAEEVAPQLGTDPVIVRRVADDTLARPAVPVCSHRSSATSTPASSARGPSPSSSARISWPRRSATCAPSRCRP